MASVNKVILIGHLGADPETRYTQNGQAVCTVSVATSESWKDKNTGERKEATEWHRVVFYGKLAEIAGQYLQKGAETYIEGSLHTRKWQDQNGLDRYTTEIRGDVMKMLGKKSDGAPAARQQADPPRQQAAPQRQQPAPKPAPDQDGFGDFDDDIPF